MSKVSNQTMTVQRLKSSDPGFQKTLLDSLSLPSADDHAIDAVVISILADIKVGGDEALIKYTEQFDRLSVNRVSDLEIKQVDLEAAYRSLPSEQAKLVSNWVMGEMSRRLNASEVGIENAPVSVAQLAAMIGRIADNTISNSAAKQVFDALWTEGGEVDAIIEAKGLKQMNDTGALEAIIDEVLAANPKNVEEFRAGNSKALNGLVGPIMKASKGKANPAQVNELLLKKLQG